MDISRIANGLGLVALGAGLAFSASAQDVLGKSPVPRYDLLQISVSADAIDASEFTARTAEITSCTNAMELAAEIDANVTRNRFVRASQMPSSLQDILADLPKGKATPVFSNEPDLMRVLVLCNRV